ncbi:MAG: TonB-dependent receptor [Gammaproteobacteria bacterium]
MPFALNPLPWTRLCTVCLLASHSLAPLAQGLGQRDRHAEEVIVTATRATGSLTAPSPAHARGELERIPGGIGFVEAENYLDDFAQSIGDALLFTPGVFADTSAQRENRISVRGSGLNSSFERRGITLLRDGIPITRASGLTEFQEVDPLSARYIEVYKGANGLRYGGASLGGAINIVTPTGRTAVAPVQARLEGGSFETVRGNAGFAHAGERVDVYATATGLHSDGFRAHSGVDSAYGFANVGLRLGEDLETRVYLTALSDNFELAGSLARADALANPRAAGRAVTAGPFFPGGPVTVLDPGPVADDWDRNLDVLRIANRTVARLGTTTVAAGAWYSWRGLDHAITRFAGIIDQSEHEVGAFVDGNGTLLIGGRPLRWTLGTFGNVASNDARTWSNDFGARGTLRASSDQDAANHHAYGQAELPLFHGLVAVLGLQYQYAVRDNDALFNDVSGRVTSSQLSPRIGLLWDIAEDAQAFVNLNRGFEPPTTADLTAGGALPFTPLKAQRATTVEVGTRGQRAAIAWDIALYRSWIDKELLDFGAPGAFGFVSFTDNADETLHQGLEAGVDARLAQALLAARGLRLTWRNVVTWNDFRFDDDRVFGDNTLAGVPTWLYVSELRLDATAGWYLGVNLRWVPSGPWVDFANTTDTPGYELLGITAGWRFTEALQLFGSVENVFDKHYIANVTTNANQRRENGRVFTPGQGIGVFAGVSVMF